MFPGAPLTSPQPSPSTTARSERIDRGDLYWLCADHAPEGGPAHPCVVVSDDLFNHSRILTVVVCALTSNVGRAKEPGNVLLDPGEGALPRPSVVVVSQIDSVEKSQLGPRIGRLSAARVDQIMDGLRFLERSFWR